MKNLKNLQTMVDIFKKNMNGYSSERCYKYLENKGVESGKEYYIDDNHYFVPFARKGEVYVILYYRDKEIDVESYLKRNYLI